MKYQTKRRIRKSLFIGILGLLFCAAAVFVSIRLFTTARRQVQLARLPADAGEVYRAGEDIVTIEGNILTRISSNGDPQFSAELPSEAMKVVGSDIMTAVYKDTLLMLYDKDGNILVQHTLPTPILQVSVGDTYYAVVIQGDSQRMVSVYRTDTTAVDENILFPYQQVLDIGLFGKDDAQLWTLSLDVHSTLPISMLKTRNPGLTTTGSISINGEIVYRVETLASGFLTVGTQYVRLWDTKGNETFSQLVYGWVLQDVQMDSRGRLQFLFCPADADGTGLHSSAWYLRLEEDGTTTQYRYSLPTDCLACVFAKKDVAALTSENLYHIPYQGGKASQTSLPVVISSVTEMITGKALVVEGDGEEYLLVLK